MVGRSSVSTTATTLLLASVSVSVSVHHQQQASAFVPSTIRPSTAASIPIIGGETGAFTGAFTGTGVSVAPSPVKRSSSLFSSWTHSNERQRRGQGQWSGGINSLSGGGYGQSKAHGHGHSHGQWNNAGDAGTPLNAASGFGGNSFPLKRKGDDKRANANTNAGTGTNIVPPFPSSTSTSNNTFQSQEHAEAEAAVNQAAEDSGIFFTHLTTSTDAGMQNHHTLSISRVKPNFKPKQKKPEAKTKLRTNPNPNFPVTKPKPAPPAPSPSSTHYFTKAKHPPAKKQQPQQWAPHSNADANANVDAPIHKDVSSSPHQSQYQNQLSSSSLHKNTNTNDDIITTDPDPQSTEQSQSLQHQQLHQQEFAQQIIIVEQQNKKQVEQMKEQAKEERKELTTEMTNWFNDKLTMLMGEHKSETNTLRETIDQQAVELTKMAKELKDGKDALKENMMLWYDEKLKSLTQDHDREVVHLKDTVAAQARELEIMQAKLDGGQKIIIPKLTKPGYFIRPTIDALSKMTEAQLSAVSNLSVERPGVGKIEWDGSVDVRGIDFDDVVVIEQNSISVHANEEKRGMAPPPGMKLNRSSVLTFHNVFPEQGRNAFHDVKMAFAKEIRAITEQIKAQFIMFDTEKGIWKIRVSNQDITSDPNQNMNPNMQTKTQTQTQTDVNYTTHTATFAPVIGETTNNMIANESGSNATTQNTIGQATSNIPQPDKKPEDATTTGTDLHMNKNEKITSTHQTSNSIGKVNTKSYLPKLTKRGYIMTPSMEALSKMSEADLAALNNFSIEKPGEGRIEWDGAVDVRGADLDNIVDIQRNVISVYKGKVSAPAYGTKLNRSAVLTLYDVFPEEGGKNATRGTKRYFKTQIENVTKNKMGAKIIKMDVDEGIWSFRVAEFGK